MVTLLLCLHTLPFVIWLFLYHIHFQFPQNSFWLYRFFILIYSYVCETLDVSLHLRISCVFPLFFVMYNESYVENVYTIRYKCFDRSIARLNIIFLRFCLLCITRSYRIMSVPECIRNVHVVFICMKFPGHLFSLFLAYSVVADSPLISPPPTILVLGVSLKPHLV